MTTLPFTNKQEYLTWRTQWKTNYAALSENIRKHKADRKDKDPLVRAIAQSQCYVCRRKAALMLEERKASKVQAQQQYQAAHAVPAQSLL